MTTKSGNLSLREKQRIEEQIKCSRDRKRLHVVEVLEKKREVIEKLFNKKIEELQRQSEDIRLEREEAVRKAGYSKIRERGCYDVHPDLDAFDAETNKILVELWKTSEPTADQFANIEHSGKNKVVQVAADMINQFGIEGARDVMDAVQKAKQENQE